MDATALTKRIMASGADEKGIHDRFGDNAELYESCFVEFMEEPSFVALRDAIHTQSYEQAFEAAHALKGLSGNLGVTGFYDAIRMLTESLRNAKYDNIDEEYAEVERQHERLKRIASEETVSKREAAPEALPHVEGKRARFAWFRSLIKDKNDRFLAYLLCAIIVIIAAIGFLLGRLVVVHDRDVVAESGQHLTEISNQIKLYIEENIATDWKIARSVGDSILSSAYIDDDPAVYSMLQSKQEVWGVSDLMLYTENGYCIYSDGSTEATDVAVMNVYHAREYGKWLSVIDSKLIYTIPLTTTLTFHGSEIVAVSVVREMSSFLDDMKFSSFGGTAWMYLTDRDGILVSSLTGPNTKQAFNIQAITRETVILPLDEAGSPEDFLRCGDTEVFTLSDAVGKNYGVSTPIVTDATAPMRLFYFVPENVVNHTMSAFSRRLTIICMITIVMVAACAFTGFLFVYRSRKKTFDRALIAREKMFDLLVKNTITAFGLVTVDRAQPEYLSANAAEIMGDSHWTLCKTDAGYHIYNEENIETDNIVLVNEALKDWDGKSTFRSGYLCNKKSATPTYFIFELYPEADNESNFVGIAQDVTPIYAREKAVKNAMEIATQANSAKTRFLSSMSHDIRTPMNAIMNMSKFALENVDQPEKIGDYLRIIQESSEHLLQLINDVLDMSRIESGELVIACVPFNLRAEMQRQTEIIRPICRARKQTLITDFSGLKETVVSGDALKLSQIVINLLSNAAKFTPEKGAVRFIAKEIPSLREDIVAVCFTVEDNGIGISEADCKHIFEPFHRANDKTVIKTEGAGLGLTIVKNYVDAMGGTIRCESELGGGSIFTVEMVFQKADPSDDADNPLAVLSDASFPGLHALVVEDNHINQIIAKEMLERMGFSLDFADDGSQAVERFRASRPDTYDVIYMDIQMPVMDGLTAAAQIRACDHPQATTIPIIAMSANAFAEDIEKARAVGMDGYVDKPIVSSKLADQTKRAIQDKRGETI